MVTDGKDGGMISNYALWIWEVLRTMPGSLERKGTAFYSEFGFPLAYTQLIPWAFRKPDVVSALRAAVAWHVSIDSNFAGPLEVELAKQLFKTCVGNGSRLLIFSAREWRKLANAGRVHASDVVLLNLNETHYNWVEFF
jgi:hypothetical protein